MTVTPVKLILDVDTNTGSVSSPAAPACTGSTPGPRCQQADTSRVSPVTDTRVAVLHA